MARKMSVIEGNQGRWIYYWNLAPTILNESGRSKNLSTISLRAKIDVGIDKLLWCTISYNSTLYLFSPLSTFIKKLHNLLTYPICT